MSTDKKREIPNAPVPTSSVPGNLLSSVAPPSQLPNFVMSTALPPEAIPPPNPQMLPPGLPSQPVVVPQNIKPQPESPELFSPAIPKSKGEPTVCIRSNEDTMDTLTPSDSLPDSTLDVDQLGDIMPGSGLFTWVKGAVSTGGILHRVAEKAKSSVDSMITTLDPQMKEYLKSGGDMYVVVASDKDVKVSPIREAFQMVFGKATVVGYPAQSDVTAIQPVGYAAAYAAAKQRIAYLRSVNGDLNNNVPIVAIEGFLHEAIADRWYDTSLLVLSLPSLAVELQVQSQSTAVPSAAAMAAKAATGTDYPHSETGFSATIGAIMADSLQVSHTQWQEALTGVSRREILLLAAKSLAGSYKKILAVSAAET